MRHLLLALSGLYCIISCQAAPIRDMLGSKMLALSQEEGSGIPYVSDGLTYWLDGIDGLWDDGNYWIDLIAGVKIRNSYQVDGLYAAAYSQPGKRVPITTSQTFIIESDFTLECLMETPSRAVWYSWCLIGIGRADGIHNGIGLCGENSKMGVMYRKQYSGTILNNVQLTSVKYGDTIDIAIVFYYSSLTYEVYVNGVYVGSSTILAENWNLDGKNDIRIGSDFYEIASPYNDNFKRYNILFYNRALSADEVAHNFEVDIERFGL